MTSSARPSGLEGATVNKPFDFLAYVRGVFITVIWPLSTLGLVYSSLLPWKSSDEHLSGVFTAHIIWASAAVLGGLYAGFNPENVSGILPEAGQFGWWVATWIFVGFLVGLLAVKYRMIAAERPTAVDARTARVAKEREAHIAYAQALFSSAATAGSIVNQEEVNVGTTKETFVTAAAFFWGWVLIGPVWLLSTFVKHHRRSGAEKAGAWYGFALSLIAISSLVLAVGIFDGGPLFGVFWGGVIAAITRYYQRSNTVMSRITAHTRLSTLGAPPSQVTLGGGTLGRNNGRAVRTDSTRLMFDSGTGVRASSVSPSLTPTPAVPSSSSSPLPPIASTSSPIAQNKDKGSPSAPSAEDEKESEKREAAKQQELAASADASAEAAAAALLGRPSLPQSSNDPPISPSNVTAHPTSSPPPVASTSTSAASAGGSGEDLPVGPIASPNSSSSASRTSSADSVDNTPDKDEEVKRIPMPSERNPLTGGADVIAAAGKLAAPQHMVYVGPERANAFNPAGAPAGNMSFGGAVSAPLPPTMGPSEPVPPNAGTGGGWAAPAAPPPPPAPPSQSVNSNSVEA